MTDPFLALRGRVLPEFLSHPQPRCQPQPVHPPALRGVTSKPQAPSTEALCPASLSSAQLPSQHACPHLVPGLPVFITVPFLPPSAPQVQGGDSSLGKPSPGS